MKENSLGLVQEFVGFIKKYGVIGLALGIVVGGAVKDLVDSLVANIVDPILGLLIPNVDNLAGWGVGPDEAIKLGAFLSACIGFVALMFVVFIVMKVFISKFVSEDELSNV